MVTRKCMYIRTYIRSIQIHTYVTCIYLLFIFIGLHNIHNMYIHT